ncbi:odorant receptor Or2-like [Diprion similis]|uniref:odorant receptor Or2-like n=1 Tax=Diprion similis TaxID=362088 RepID=UPI001EF8E7DE|nr:odorant receptor Or2-like [Diprion similis]
MSGQDSFWDHFWFARLFFQLSGILPISGESFLWKKFLTQFLAVFPMLYSFFVLIPQINFILFRNYNTDDLLEAMLIMTAVLTGQTRSIFVTIYRHRITRLFTACEELWDQSVPADRQLISTWIRQAKIISTMYFCAANCLVTVFVVTATLQQFSLPENSTTKYYPFTPQEDSTPSPEYEIKYAVQVICCFCSMSYIAACDMTGTILTLYLCGQLALVKRWLRDNSSKEKFSEMKGNINEGLEESLKKCIRRHQIVLELCSELENVIQYNYLIQIITEMYIMALSAASFTKSSGSFRHFATFILSINGLFLSCWPSDTLSYESTEIAQAIYEVPWYDGSPRVKTMVAVLMARSQRPAILTAGKFIPLSLEAFSSITSSGISFCMLLRSL